MTLAVSGSATTVNTKVGGIIQPFKNVNIADSLGTGNTTNDRGSITITITDLATGLPTDSDGTIPLAYYITHPAIGVYVLSEPSGYLNGDLKALNLTVGTKSSTALVGLVVADSHGQTATDTQTQVVNAVPPTNFIVGDQTSGITYASAGQAYSGALAFANQYVVQTENAVITTHNLNISAVTPNTFIHSGSGTDAINVSTVGGNNILDGSTGSNFLTGSTKGTDTFFVDDRNAPSDIWSTIVNFHSGDMATLFGVTSQTPIAMVDNQGASGYSGLTFHTSTPGQPVASFTLTGYSISDITKGVLALNYGTEPDGTSFLAISGGR